jgi:hypothetical protein
MKVNARRGAWASSSGDTFGIVPATVVPRLLVSPGRPLFHDKGRPRVAPPGRCTHRPM